MVPEGIEVISQNDFSAGLRRAGLRGPMGYAVTSKTQRSLLLRVIRKAVERTEIAGAIVGRVRAGRKGLELVTMFVDASDELPVDEAIPLQGNDDDQLASIDAALSDVLTALAPPPPEPEPEPLDEPEAEPEPEQEPEQSDFKPNRPGSELFAIDLGAEFGGRFFSYNEPCSGPDNPCPGTYRTLRPYDVFGVPAVRVAGVVYPAAPLDITVLSDLGVSLQYTHYFGLKSQTENGDATFGTSWNRFAAGLRYRLRIGDADDHPVVISPDVRFGFVNFTFEPQDAGANAIVDEIGTVEYLFIRGGVDARLPLGEIVAMMPSIGIVGPLSTGAAYDRVSGASVLGMDAGLMVALVLGLGIETRAGIEYTRFFASFDPQPTDQFVAGGATDEYLSLRVAGAYVF